MQQYRRPSDCPPMIVMHAARPFRDGGFSQPLEAAKKSKGAWPVTRRAGSLRKESVHSRTLIC